MRNLNKDDERKLLDGVKTAVSLVDSEGMSPNDALGKVARDLNYSPGFLKSACYAFNTGRQLAQWQEGGSAVDRLTSFPLADYTTIHDSIWNAPATKTAVDSVVAPTIRSYADMEREAYERAEFSYVCKSASAEVSEELTDHVAGVKCGKMLQEHDRNVREAEEAKRQKSAADDELHATIGKIESYFRKFAHDRLPFAQVEFAVGTYFGSAGRDVMTCLAERLPNEKRAADYPKSWRGFRDAAVRTKEPYSLISEAIAKKAAYDLADAAFAKAEEKVRHSESTIKQAVSRHREAPPEPLTMSLMPEKKAAIPSIKSMIDKSTVNSDSRVRNKMLEIDSPSHLNEIRKIKAQAALTRLMSDPENPISQYEPEKVLTAYNDLVQASPRIADQPASLDTLLAKRVSGYTEPFEILQALEMESGLKNTQSASVPSAYSKSEARPSSMNIMGKANDKLV